MATFPSSLRRSRPVAKPEKARVSYDETMTLMACIELPAGALPAQPG